MAGTMNEEAAVVDVAEFRKLNVPVAINDPLVPNARHRMIISHNHDEPEVMLAVKVIAAVLTIIVPLASVPFPQYSDAVPFPGVAPVTSLPKMVSRTAFPTHPK